MDTEIKPAESNEPGASMLGVVQNEGQRLAQDLERARALLRDAMGKIASFVQALNDGVEHAHSLSEHQPSELQAALNALRNDATKAMLGLQVEDVLGQLIEGTRARLDMFSSVSSALAELVSQRPSLKPSPDVEERLRSIQDTQLTSVKQTSLDAGEAELF